MATGGLFIFPHLLGFRPDAGSRTFLPFTLVSIHAAQILQNEEKEHLSTDTETASPDQEDRFYQELKQAWIEARKVPLGCPTLGFAPDYIMYTKDFFRGFAAEQKLTDSELIRLCYTTYFKTWIGSPGAMLAKIGKELRIFLSAPSRDFAAHSVSRRRALDISARFSPSPQDLLTVGVVHTLDLDRYRTGYVPALLLTLAIMATVLFAVAERFRKARIQEGGPSLLKPFQIRFPLPSMTVNDRVDRCRPVTGWHIVPQERKLEAAAAE